MSFKGINTINSSHPFAWMLGGRTRTLSELSFKTPLFSTIKVIGEQQEIFPDA
jgi:hypothetical protein